MRADALIPPAGEIPLRHAAQFRANWANTALNSTRRRAPGPVAWWCACMPLTPTQRPTATRWSPRRWRWVWPSCAGRWCPMSGPLERRLGRLEAGTGIGASRFGRPGAIRPPHPTTISASAAVPETAGRGRPAPVSVRFGHARRLRRRRPLITGRTNSSTRSGRYRCGMIMAPLEASIRATRTTWPILRRYDPLNPTQEPTCESGMRIDQSRRPWPHRQ